MTAETHNERKWRLQCEMLKAMMDPATTAYQTTMKTLVAWVLELETQNQTLLEANNAYAAGLTMDEKQTADLLKDYPHLLNEKDEAEKAAKTLKAEVETLKAEKAAAGEKFNELYHSTSNVQFEQAKHDQEIKTLKAEHAKEKATWAKLFDDKLEEEKKRILNEWAPSVARGHLALFQSTGDTQYLIGNTVCDGCSKWYEGLQECKRQMEQQDGEYKQAINEAKELRSQAMVYQQELRVEAQGVVAEARRLITNRDLEIERLRSDKGKDSEVARLQSHIEFLTNQGQSILNELEPYRRGDNTMSKAFNEIKAELDEKKTEIEQMKDDLRVKDGEILDLKADLQEHEHKFNGYVCKKHGEIHQGPCPDNYKFRRPIHQNNYHNNNQGSGNGNGNGNGGGGGGNGRIRPNRYGNRLPPHHGGYRPPHHNNNGGNRPHSNGDVSMGGT